MGSVQTGHDSVVGQDGGRVVGGQVGHVTVGGHDGERGVGGHVKIGWVFVENKYRVIHIVCTHYYIRMHSYLVWMDKWDMFEEEGMSDM